MTETREIRLSDLPARNGVVHSDHLLIPDNLVGTLTAYCESTSCDVRTFKMDIKTTDGDLRVNAAYLTCPICHKKSSTWIEFSSESLTDIEIVFKANPHGRLKP